MEEGLGAWTSESEGEEGLEPGLLGPREKDSGGLGFWTLALREEGLGGLDSWVPKR